VSLASAGGLLAAVAQGAAVVAVVILILMIGLSLGLDRFKLRNSGPKSLTVRSLDEALGQPQTYLPADTPRGTTDQLGNSRRPA
jgi:hypothetical protein